MKRLVVLLAVLSVLALCLNGQVRGLRDPGFVAKLNATTASFSPTSISGLKLWLRASDDSGNNVSVYKDDLTTLCANNESALAWKDESGNGYTVKQATSANRPVFETGILNSKSAIHFTTASAHRLFTNSVWGVKTNTTFLVIKSTNNTVASTFLLIGSGNGYGFGVESDQARNAYNRGVANIKDGTMSGTSFELWSSQYDGANKSLWINTSAVSLVGSNSSMTTPSTAISVGARDADSGSLPFGGWICEIIVYSEAISSMNKSAVESYLSSKYGL